MITSFNAKEWVTEIFGSKFGKKVDEDLELVCLEEDVDDEEDDEEEDDEEEEDEDDEDEDGEEEELSADDIRKMKKKELTELIDEYELDLDASDYKKAIKLADAIIEEMELEDDEDEEDDEEDDDEEDDDEDEDEDEDEAADPVKGDTVLFKPAGGQRRIRGKVKLVKGGIVKIEDRKGDIHKMKIGMVEVAE